MPLLRHSWSVGLLAVVLVAFAARPALGQDQPSQGGQGQPGQANQGQTNQGQTNQDQTSQPSQGDQNTAQPGAPIPAYRSPLASAADNGSPTEQDLQPDTRALSGVETLSLGGLKASHSYWQPHVDIFESADSNVGETTSGSAWGSWTSISAGVDVHHISGNTDLLLTYTGGGVFSSSAGANNGMIQELGFTDRVQLHRWTLTFLDQLSYLTESAFGFGGFSGASLPGSSFGGGIGGIGSSFLTGQSLLVSQGRSVSNFLATEGDLALTRRSSLTLVGGYSLLDYPDSNLLNSWAANARIGYNYLLTPKDTIAVFYTYSGFRYTNFDQYVDSHSFQVSYGRRVTGRLAFQVAAGPEIVVSRLPISGIGTGSSSTNTTQLLWSLDTSTRYQMRRVGLGVRYDHGVSSGSGVLAGSVADIVEGDVTRQMSPTFSSVLLAGYSRNSGEAIAVTTPTAQSYDYWYVGTNLTHPLGTFGLTFSYQLQYQTSNVPFCTGPSCGTNLIRHLISVGAGWHGNRQVFR